MFLAHIHKKILRTLSFGGHLGRHLLVSGIILFLIKDILKSNTIFFFFWGGGGVLSSRHPDYKLSAFVLILGWLGGAMVLGKLPVPGRPTIWITVGQWPTALAVDAGGDCLDIFVLIYPISPLSSSLWETARYRLKYCLKGP